MTLANNWESYLPEQLRADLPKLPKGLLDHCKRVSKVSEALAKRFGCDAAKAKATAMAHDITRALGGEELLAMAARFGLHPSDIEEAFPILLHAQVGAEILRRDYGLADGEMLDAIASHTTGRRAMGLLDKVLFLADKVEPEKVRFRPELEEVAELAKNDLDRSLLKFFDLQLVAFVAAGSPIQPAMVEARNDTLTRLQRRGATRYH